MNLPNQLTTARLVLTLFFVASLSIQFPYNATVALLLFSVAAITDFLDGHIARKHNLITDFGKLMDPLADKIMMAAAFVLLVELDCIPAWIVIAILGREFLVTGLRTLASSKGVIMAAENLGKHKTIWQIITALFFLLWLALMQFELPPQAIQVLDWIKLYIGFCLLAITAALTMLSGLSYLWKNRTLLQSM